MRVELLPDPNQRVIDDRFSTLLGRSNWLKLPKPIRYRFGHRVKGGESIAYQGVVVEMRLNWAGRLLAHAARLLGAPLPYDASCVGQPAVVVVTEDVAGKGQFWIRQYGRKSGFPQIVHSSKKFSGPTGLEEYIGYGIGMALRVEATSSVLWFKSDHYFLTLFGKRLRLPKWLGPGALTIGHHHLGEGRFNFSLRLRSDLFGELLSQDAVFEDGVR